jgi:dienelactone hydrolase
VSDQSSWSSRAPAARPHGAVWLWACMVAAAVLAACASTTSAPSKLTVMVPWRPGRADAFQTGSPEERYARAAHGQLPVALYKPDGGGPFPFVVLLHGCGGLHREAMWTAWVDPWVELLRGQGVAAAVVDSFGPRGVDQVCRGGVAAWAIRRADDADSVRAWLAARPDVDAGRIAVFGMSNGGRTVLATLRAPRAHAEPFRAGIALYPGCQTDTTSTFYAPLLVLIGRGDTVTPPRFCEEMKRAQPETGPDVRLVVYPNGPHTFDMRLPDRTVLGMRMGYDPQAATDARRQVIDFLTAHGLIDGGRSPRSP